MTFRHGQCKGTTKKGKPCSVGAKDSINGFCGPHLDQALRLATKAFKDLKPEEAAYFAQLAESMLEQEVDPDLSFLRDNFRRLNNKENT